MGSNLTAEEVVLINNLNYCENLGGPKGTFLHPSQESRTIGDYVRGVLRNASLIDDATEYSTGVTGAEFKEFLGAVDKNDHLKEMIIQEVHYESDVAGGGRSVFLIDPQFNEAIIAFKGTQSNAEWVDNVSGLYKVPTAFQENALLWFRSLDLEGFDTITVTGHSKGGNKAKFITIMDDRVDSCFSFDGQGFSDEFIKKYSAKILKNRGKILNINAESDFVNILLNDVGKRDFYLGTNYGRLGFVENHCPNAILFFDDQGQVFLFKAKEQDKKMADLDNMLNSFVRSCKMSARESVAGMLGNVIINANSGSTEGIIGLFSDAKYSESAAKLVAYILRYKEEKPEMVESVRAILRQNGFSSGLLGIANFITNHEIIMEMIGRNPDSMIALLEMNHAPANVLSILRSHTELFDFIVRVSEKMRLLTDMDLNGRDLDPENAKQVASTDNNRVKTKQFVLCYAVFLANGMLALAIGSLLPFLRDAHGLDYAFCGLIVSLHSVGNLFSSFFSGALSMLIGRKKSILLFEIFFPISFLIMLLGGNKFLLAFAFFATGIARGASSNYCNTKINSIATGMAWALNCLHASFAVGAFVFPLLLMLITRTQSSNWVYACILLVILGVLTCITYYLIPGDEDSGKELSKGESAENGEVSNNKNSESGALGFFREPLFYVCTATLFFYLCAEQGVIGWMITYFKDTGLLPPNLAQVTASILWVMILCGRLMTAWLSTRVKKENLLPLMGVGIVLFFVVLILSKTTMPIIIGIMGFGFSMAGIYATTVSFAGELIKRYSLAWSFILTTASLGSIIMPSIVGVIADSFGIATGLGSIAIALVIDMVFIILLVRFVKREQAQTT